MAKAKSIDEALMRRFKEHFVYSVETGLFTRIGSTKLSNGKIGEVAGSVNRDGYRYLTFAGGKYKAARLAWAYCHGSCPQHLLIDHVNRARDDDRINNLRLADDYQNSSNHPIHVHNQCGVKCVYFHKQANKWCAELRHMKKRYYLGLYDRIEDAEMAVRARRVELHQQFHSHG